MKKIVTIVGALLLVFAIGSVFADQMPIMTENREVGALLGTEAPGKVLISPAKDFSRPITAEVYEAGAVLYLSAFEKTSEVTGAAAGGVAREDENTKIWNALMPGGESLE